MAFGDDGAEDAPEAASEEAEAPRYAPQATKSPVYQIGDGALERKTRFELATLTLAR